MTDKPIAAGRSSFPLIDFQQLLSELPLTGNIRFLDAACGNGPYALAVAERMPGNSQIYAFDLWQEGIDELKKKASRKKLHNINAKVVDLRKKLPVEDDSFDICLLATVWHDFMAEGTETEVIREIKRAMKPNGLLAVVEFKKIDGPPGPPLKIRLAPVDLEASLNKHGFKLNKTISVGPYNYLSIFRNMSK